MSNQENVRDCDELDMLAAAMEYEFFILPDSKRREELQQLEILMEAELIMYSYCNIPPGAAVIRLLHLDPASALEPLTATLQFAALSGSTRYEALSYAWGSPAKTHSISINGHLLPITRALYEALHRLRFTNKKRVLWVDAICINQQLTDEKSFQIALMGSIYSTAVCVLCWLGVDTPRKDGATALSILAKLSLAGPITRSTSIRQWAIMEGLPAYGDKRWKSLGVFFQLPWFRRRWVIQEFIKGTEVTLICGDLEIDWVDIVYGMLRFVDLNLIDWAFDDDQIRFTEFLVAGQGLMNFFAIVGLKPKADCSPDIARLIRFAYEGRIADVEDAPQWLRSMNPAIMSVIYKGMTTVEKHTRAGAFKGTAFDTPSPKGLSLAELLLSCRASLASDPRDYIFALLGLAEDGKDLALRLNYGESVRTLYTRCSRFLIEQGAAAGSMKQLVFVDTSKIQEFGSSVTLPSWVCNWANAGLMRPEPTMLQRGITSEYYRAAAETTPQIRFDAHNSDLLYLTGGFFATIKRIIRNPTSGSPYNHVGMSHILRGYIVRDHFLQLDKVMLNRRKRYPYLTRPTSYIYDPDSIEHDLEVLWRLLICNSIDGVMEPGEETESSFLEFRFMHGLSENHTHRPPMTSAQQRDVELRNKSDTKDVAERPLSWEVQWASNAGYLTFAELHNGLCGLVPYTSRVGDRVFIPLGSGVPLIIRNSIDAKVPVKFELVGGAYVHGIMDGEALHTPDWRVEEVCLA